MSERNDQESDAAARQRRLEALRALAAAPPPSAARASAPPATPSPAPASAPSPAPSAIPIGAPSAPSAQVAPPQADTPSIVSPIAARPADLASMVVGSARRRRTREAQAAPTTRLARRPRRAPVVLRVGLALVVVAVVAGVGALLWLHRPIPAAPIPDPLTIRFNSATMACPQNAAWSPDGSQVAVLGYLACNGQSNFGGQSQPNTGGTLLLYNAATGHLDADIGLDSATETLVPASVRSDSAALRAISFSYNSLMWSPNGRQLAIQFSVDNNSNLQYTQNGPPTGGINYGQGVLVVTAASHATALLTQPAPSQINYTSNSFQPLPVERWDLSAGTSTLTSLPQALAYAWNGDDSLAPTTPLPTSSTAPAPQAPQGAVGNPDGGQSFTVWQVGFVNFGQFCNSPNNPAEQNICCPITTFLSGGLFAFGAWSPDGRILLLPYGSGIGATGKVPAPAGTPAPAAQPGCPLPGQETSSNLANLPVRDAAMAEIIKTLVPQPAYTQFGPPPSTAGASGADFVWSPDGKRVIVSEQLDSGPSASTPVFSVYDTTSGKQSASFSTTRLIALGHLPTNELDNGQSLYASATLWSPDSQRLLVLDDNDHFMLLLGAKSLAG